MSHLRLCRSWAKVISTVLITSAAFLGGNIPLRAQETDFKALVTPLAKEIAHTHKHRFVVLPLFCSDEKNLPLADWLTQQISSSIVSNVPGLEPIAVSSLSVPLQIKTESGLPTYDPVAVDEFAKKVGAEIIVDGSCGPYGNGLGITVSASQIGQQWTFTHNNGLLALTPEITALVSQPMHFQPPPDGIYRAGLGGVGVPQCLKCPDPKYPEKLRKKHREGFVVLDVVVGPEGLAHQIAIKKATDENFAMPAENAVKKWKFKPATGPDGKPVAVRVAVDITFRLF